MKKISSHFILSQGVPRSSSARWRAILFIEVKYFRVFMSGEVFIFQKVATNHVDNRHLCSVILLFGSGTSKHVISCFALLWMPAPSSGKITSTLRMRLKMLF